MFKKVFTLGLALIAPSIFAHELTSYDAIELALITGKNVSGVVYMKKCAVIDQNTNKMPLSIAVFKSETSLITEEHLSFDAVKYSRVIPPAAPNGLMQRVSMYLEKNGAFSAVVAFFDAENNLKSYRKDVTLNCKLGESVRFYQN